MFNFTPPQKFFSFFSVELFVFFSFLFYIFRVSVVFSFFVFQVFFFFSLRRFFSRDKKNRFYASVGAQVETHTQKARRRCAARAVEGTIDAALSSTTAAATTRLLVSTSFPRSKSFPEGRKNARAMSSFSFFSLFFFIATSARKSWHIFGAIFFSPKTTRAREGPALKTLKITHFEVKRRDED